MTPTQQSDLDPSDDCTAVTRLYRKKRLRTLIDAMPMLIAYVNRQQRYCFTNLSHRDWFGRAGETLTGMSMRSVWGEEAYRRLLPFVERVLSGQQVKFELRVPDAWLGERDICANYIPDKDKQGRSRGFFSLIDDISELREADAARNRHLQKTAHTARLNLMGELTGQIVHQVSQPLSAIVTFAEACGRLLSSAEHTPRELTEALDEIAAEAQRASEIVRRIRGFVSKHEPHIRPTDINALVRETLHLVELDPNWRGMRFQLEQDERAARVPADPVMIEQVILNLVHNALEAMEDLPLEQRRLCLRTQAYGDKYVEVSVEDRGRGLNPRAREHLFEPFSTTKKNGMGMGLAISRSIVKHHGGSLWATDNLCGGTTFRFTLPQQHESAQRPSA